MTKNTLQHYAWLVISCIATTPFIVSAHEAYVVENNYFWEELNKSYSTHALDALLNSHNLNITIYITIGIIAMLAANFLFRLTKVGQYIHHFPERYAHFGPIFIRVTIAGALFFSATSNSFLGPELSLHAFSMPQVVRSGLFVVSIMIAFGFLTEIAAFISLLLYAAAGKVYGAYIFTYANYLGEFIVLLLFGMRRWSVDTTLFGKLSQLRAHWEKYESTIVRMFYGFALIYAGITVKFLHPELTVKVATDWNLAQFYWLFPSDPLLITLGAGLSEVAIGLFIMIGFEMRLSVLISLFYITLSLLYFRELVWPHYLLYGISLNLLVQPETFTLDHVFFAHHRQHMRWWLRPFLHHNAKGKSAHV